MAALLVIRTFKELGLVPEAVNLGWAAVGGTLLLFAVSFVAAVALHHGVELPMMRLLAPRLPTGQRAPARHANERTRRLRPAVALSAMGTGVLATSSVAFAVCINHL